jgi:hypothetical protein
LVSGIGYPIPDFEVSGIGIGIGFEDFGINWYPIPEPIPRFSSANLLKGGNFRISSRFFLLSTENILSKLNLRSSVSKISQQCSIFSNFLKTKPTKSVLINNVLDLIRI